MHFDSNTTRDDEQSEPLLFNAVTNSMQLLGVKPMVEHQQYNRRWYILAVVALLNLSNGMIWMTFSSIADSTASYYHVDPMSVNWLSIVFMITTVVLGFLGIWLLDNRGLRSCLIIAAWLNGIGAAGRILSTLPSLGQHQFTVLIIFQTIAGCAQPFMMFTPTKLASQWFSENQRTFANMLGSTANPIGIMLGSVLSTVILPRIEEQNKMPLLLEVYAAPALLGIVLTTFGVCSSVPPSPPSSSAAEICEPFIAGIKKLIRIRSYWVLAVCFGAGIGLLSTFVTILEQLLCVHGYSDIFVGVSSALLFGVGLIGASVISLIVDRTRQFEVAAKVCFAVAGFMLIAFMVAAHYPNMKILLAFITVSLGFFGLALNPLCLELAVECTFPVAEGTSAGILILSGQIQAALYTFLMNIGVNVNKSQTEMCLHGDIINTYAVVGFIAVTGFFTILFISTFHCNYRRQCVEEHLKAMRTVQENPRTIHVS